MSLILTTLPLLIANTNLSYTNMSGITRDILIQYMMVTILEWNEKLIGLYTKLFMDMVIGLRIVFITLNV